MRKRCSPYAAHLHPPSKPTGQPGHLVHQQQGPPGARSPGAPGPIDAIPVPRMNDLYMHQTQAISDRLEADSRGYDAVFSQ